MSSYECNRCGACCKHGPVDLWLMDLLREPRLGEHASLYRKPEPDGRIGYLLPIPEIGFPLLDENECCSIHATRLSASSLLEAGSKECQEARQACGLQPLAPAGTSRCVSTTPVEESSAMARQNERNGGRNEKSREDRGTGERNRPVHAARLGRIMAAIGQNSTENGPRHNVTVSRLYKDGDQWKDTTSLGRDDLPLVAKVADLAHTWIFEQAGRE